MQERIALVQLVYLNPRDRSPALKNIFAGEITRGISVDTFREITFARGKKPVARFVWKANIFAYEIYDATKVH